TDLVIESDESVASAIEARVAVPEGAPKPDTISREVAALYADEEFHPLWIRAGKATVRATELMQVLRNASDKGLQPMDYVGPWVAVDVTGKVPHDERSAVDVAITTAAVRLVSDLRFGRANPGVYDSATTKGSQPELAALVRQSVLEPASLDEGLAALDPPDPGFGRLLEGLKTYRELATKEVPEDTDFLPAAPNGKPVEPGTTYSGAKQLAQVLALVGDLSAEDQARVEQSEAPAYDGALLTAAKKFQERHGLEPDGRLGRATLAELRQPISDRVQKIELTLERMRWMPRTEMRSVVVNVPEFRLRAGSKPGDAELSANVVVGLDGKVSSTNTPLFTAKMTYVTFHPYWNVPTSIQRKELVPAITKDRDYLAKHDYEVIDGKGNIITAEAVTDDVLAQLRVGRLTIRQRPGPQNALGAVAFMFPNAFDVYIHDTPSKSFFARAQRALSHGCIRVEKPADFAAWVLSGQEDGDKEWDAKTISEEVSQGKELRKVPLTHPIQVFIVYQTAAVQENGEIRFFTDMYGYDAKLAKQLAERNSPDKITSAAPGPRPRV
ncbi:MAG: L,D-transpeptidase family protein, partial [Acidobacteriota bacterium]